MRDKGLGIVQDLAPHYSILLSGLTKIKFKLIKYNKFENKVLIMQYYNQLIIIFL